MSLFIWKKVRIDDLQRELERTKMLRYIYPIDIVEYSARYSLSRRGGYLRSRPGGPLRGLVMPKSMLLPVMDGRRIGIEVSRGIVGLYQEGDQLILLPQS